jgi:hypothetical protein
MKLKPEVAAALERLRKYKTTNSGAEAYAAEIAIGYGDTLDLAGRLTVVAALSTADAFLAAASMLSLFPHGHADEITVERLLACGGRRDGFWVVWSSPEFSHPQVAYSDVDGVWLLYGRRVDEELAPRNVGEVWQLLARCGIEVRQWTA